MRRLAGSRHRLNWKDYLLGTSTPQYFLPTVKAGPSSHRGLIRWQSVGTFAQCQFNTRWEMTPLLVGVCSIHALTSGELAVK